MRTVLLRGTMKNVRVGWSTEQKHTRGKSGLIQIDFRTRVYWIHRKLGQSSRTTDPSSETYWTNNRPDQGSKTVNLTETGWNMDEIKKKHNNKV